MAFDTAGAVIANGASLSQAIDLGDLLLAGISIPASWTAADLTFKGSVDGVTFQDLYDAAGTEVTADAAAARHIVLEPAKFAGMRSVKIRSGTTGSPVTQGAARTLTAVLLRG